jgi:hypothetical protein
VDNYLATILPPIATRALSTDCETRQAVGDALTIVQQYGSEKALSIIRKKVPTYSPTI